MKTEGGTALLEAVAALSILSIAALAATTAATEAVRAVHRVQEAAARAEQADAFLHAVSLWPSEDLDRRLGERRQGPWWLRVDRIRPGLYAVALRDTASGRVLLRTVLYRTRRQGGR